MADPWESVADTFIEADQVVRPRPATPSPTPAPTPTPRPAAPTIERPRRPAPRPTPQPTPKPLPPKVDPRLDTPLPPKQPPASALPALPAEGRVPNFPDTPLPPKAPPGLPDDFDIKQYLTSTTYRLATARRVRNAVGRAALKKLDQAEMFFGPIMEIVGPRALTVTRELSKLAPESSIIGQQAQGDGLFKVNPESEDLAFKFVTGQGDLSGPELAGILRSNFQDRSIADQILLGAIADPLNVPLPAKAALTVPARAAARVAGRTRAVEEAAPVLRRAIERGGGPEAGRAGIPGGGDEAIPPPRRRTIEELRDAGVVQRRPGEFTAKGMENAIEENLAEQSLLRRVESKAGRVFNDLDDFNEGEIEFLEDLIPEKELADITFSDIQSAVRKQIGESETSIGRLRRDLEVRIAQDAEDEAAAIQRGIDRIGLTEPEIPPEVIPTTPAAREVAEEIPTTARPGAAPAAREERRWLEREVQDPERGFASVGEEPERAVWGVKSGDTLETGSLDYVGYGEGPATLRGIHIGDSDFWKVQLEKDYGLSQADARTIKIRTIEGDAYLPDRQYNIPPEVGEMGESQVLVTKRTQLEYGKDWVFEGETFAPPTTARAGAAPAARAAEDVTTAKGDVRLYRGQVQGGQGRYYSTDKDFARAFTQSGRESEISEIVVPASRVYRGKELPFAKDVDAIDKTLIDARAKGYDAIWVDEGLGQPPSVLFAVDDVSIIPTLPNQAEWLPPHPLIAVPDMTTPAAREVAEEIPTTARGAGIPGGGGADLPPKVPGAPQESPPPPTPPKPPTTPPPTPPRAGLPEFLRRNPHSKDTEVVSARTSNLTQERIDGFNALPDDAEIEVFHATSDVNADAILEGRTIVPELQGGGIRGASDRIFVGTDPISVSRLGPRVLALTVRKSQLLASPEFLRGRPVGDVGQALVQGAATGAVVDGAPIRAVDVSQFPRSNAYEALSGSPERLTTMSIEEAERQIKAARAAQRAGRTKSASPEMPAEEADEIIRRFGELIASSEGRFAEQKALRSTEIARRAKRAGIRAQELIAEGTSPEQAVILARKELGGPLPVVETGLDAMAVRDVKTALFAKIERDLGHDFLAWNNTNEALSNALTGRAIPNVPGTAGGSAFRLLSRVFPPEVVESLGKIDELVQGRAPSIVERHDFPANRPVVQGRLAEEAVDPTELTLRPQEGPLGGPIPGDVPTMGNIPPDPRTPGQRILDTEELGTRIAPDPTPPEALVPFPEENIALRTPDTSTARLGEAPQQFREPPFDPRTQKQRINEGELDAQQFGATIAPAPTTPRKPLAIGASIDDVSAEQAYLMPPKDTRLLQRIGKELGLTVLDLGNLLRANKSSFDLAFPRQQAMLIWGHPGKFAKSFRDALRSVWSADYAKALDEAIRSDPRFELYKKINGTFIRPLDGAVAKRWEANEETMILTLTKDQANARPLQRLAQKLPWITISARAHITGTNTMNWRIFTDHVDTLMEIERQIGIGQITGNVEHGLLRRQMTQLFGNPKQIANAMSEAKVEQFSVEKSARGIERMLADMTGRTNVEGLGKLTPAMNFGFFSLRLLMGRLISPRHMASRDAFVRRQAWKNFITGITGMSAVALAGFKMGLWDVEFDSRSADFMNIKLPGGRVSIDIWGGYKQFWVLYARLVSSILTPDQAMKTFTTGELHPVDPVSLTGNTLIRNKVAPLLGLTLEAWTGKDFKGSKIDRTDWRRWLKEGGGPLAGVDIYEAFDAEEITGLAGGASAVIGAGVLVTELPRWKELDPYYNMGKGKTPEEARKARVIFRERNPDLEAKLFIQQKITTLSTERAKDRVKVLIDELKINPDDILAYKKVFTPWLVEDPVPEPEDQSIFDRVRSLIPGPEPTPTPTPTPRRPYSENNLPPKVRPTPVPSSQRWEEVRQDLTGRQLEGLAKVWFEGGRLTRAEERGLRTVFEAHPLGQTNFNTWLKQTLRQAQEATMSPVR